MPPSTAAAADVSTLLAGRELSHQSPASRAWRRFRSNRLGYVSLILFAILFGISLIAELVSNDKPLIVRYEGKWYLPVIQTLPEITFGGDFPTPTDSLG